MNLKKNTTIIFFAFLSTFPAFSATLTLSLNGLEDLGPAARYEGWLVAGGTPVSTGVFSVNGSGILSQTEFTVDDTVANQAGVFVLTIEPFPDTDPDPADSHLLAGDINAGVADVSIGHMAAIGDDLTAAAGRFILSAPSAGKGGSFENGIWYLVPPTPVAGLSLPTLPTGWVYEGWVVDTSTNTPISTGTFLDENGPDSDAGGPAAGPEPTPPFPGQDFINPPRDLTDSHVAVISVEPVPDNSPLPFTLKPLLKEIDDVIGGTQLMANNALATSPSGTIELVVGGPRGEVQQVPTVHFFSLGLLFLWILIMVWVKLNQSSYKGINQYWERYK